VTAQYDLTIQQGATFRRQFRWLADGDPVDLTGFAARMQIRRSVKAVDVLVDATTANGLLTIAALAGEVTVELPATLTAGISAVSGVYDLEMVDPGGFVTRLLEGDVTFSPEVTRG
jgi:hypothetical protein